MNSNNSKNNFNRTLILNLGYLKSEFNLSVLFNKHNTYMAYHIDPSMYHRIRQRNCIQIGFDIRKNQFCDTFCDISDYNDDGCNIQNSFDGIYTQYKDIIYYDNKETVVMDKVLQGTSFIENKIDISVLRLYKFQKEFLMCICNRHFVGDKKKKIVRSSYFGMYSRECGNYLKQLYKKYKSDGVKYQSCETAIESLFDNSSTLTPQQIQNGFQL